MRAKKLLTSRQIFGYAVPARAVSPSQKSTGTIPELILKTAVYP